MAFHGDFFSYPLPELLQWLDASRKTGALQLTWQASERKLFFLAGQIVGSAAPALWERVARLLALADLASGPAVMAAFAKVREGGELEQTFRERGVDPTLPQELAREELYGGCADMMQSQAGQFHWSEDADRTGDEWCPLQVGTRHLLFEALRWVDEQADVDKALPLDTLVVRARAGQGASRPLLDRIILKLCAGEGLTLGRVRLAMGVSRSATARRVFDLLKTGAVEVDGALRAESDPVVEMLEKGARLVRERQFEAAGLIFSTLLASDPADRRVREFAYMVEREHVASLYGQVPPLAVPRLVNDPEGLARLRPEERQVASLVNGTWDVSTIVLASQQRELETLKALVRLWRLGLVEETTPLAPS